MIAVRELDLDGSAPRSATGSTTTRVYTHGFGVVAAYGNQRTVDGKPVFLEGDIPPTGELGDLRAADLLRRAVAGLLDRRRARRARRRVELDYPDDAARPGSRTTTYTGDGGVKLGNVRHASWSTRSSSRTSSILLSDAVNDDSQILYDRDPRDRVREGRAVPDPRRRPVPGGRRRHRSCGSSTATRRSTNYPYSRGRPR